MKFRKLNPGFRNELDPLFKSPANNGFINLLIKIRSVCFIDLLHVWLKYWLNETEMMKY